MSLLSFIILPILTGAFRSLPASFGASAVLPLTLTQPGCRVRIGKNPEPTSQSNQLPLPGKGGVHMAKLLAIGLAVACVCSTLASAQDKPSDQPAKYVWYSVEKVNSGKFSVYMKTAVQFREAVSSAAPEV